MCLVLFVRLFFEKSHSFRLQKKKVYSIKQDTVTTLNKVLNHFLKEVSLFPSPSIPLTSIALDSPLLRAAFTLPGSYPHPLNICSKLTSPAPFPSKFPALPQVGTIAKPFSHRRLFQFTHPQGKLVSLFTYPTSSDPSPILYRAGPPILAKRLLLQHFFIHPLLRKGVDRRPTHQPLPN